MKLTGVGSMKGCGEFLGHYSSFPAAPILPSCRRSRLVASTQSRKITRRIVDPVQCIWDGSKRFKYKDYTGRIYREPREITDADWAHGARTSEAYTADDLRKAKLQLLEDTYAAEMKDKASRVASTVLKRSKCLAKAKRDLLQEQKLHRQQAKEDLKRHTQCMQQQLEAAQGMLVPVQDIDEQLKDTSLTPLERELLEKLSRMRTALDRPFEQSQLPGAGINTNCQQKNGHHLRSSHLYL